MSLKRQLKEALRRIAELEKAYAELKAEFEEHMKICPLVKQQNDSPPFVKPNTNHRHKKNGQKNDHKGYSRKIPERIDFIKPLVLDKCPECGGQNLSKVQETRERYVTDIPEPREPIVTKYEIPRKYCKDCKKLVEPLIVDALPNARFGLRLMILVLLLKIGMAMPIEKILELLGNQYKLKVSNGEIVHMLKQLAREFGPYYKELKQKIREAKVRYIDETGRRIGGKNHYIWAFITEEIALYAIRKSRGSKVPLQILGKNCEGVNVSDRYSAYYALLERTKCKMQVCWCHLLRESKKLAEDFEEGELIHRRLKSILKKANAFSHKGTVEDVEKLLKRLDNIRKIRFRSTMCSKFIRHLCGRDRESLFRFVTNPEIEATSNRAERGLRHDVIIRKISGGNRSKNGARVHECLLSVMQTYRLQNKNVLTDGLGYLQNQLQTAK
ncbi:IS66 family transposase [archaeon]|nr:IS66 family transposase [archaeon]